MSDLKTVADLYAVKHQCRRVAQGPRKREPCPGRQATAAVDEAAAGDHAALGGAYSQTRMDARERALADEAEALMAQATAPNVDVLDAIIAKP